jgi:hypothetical protein
MLKLDFHNGLQHNSHSLFIDLLPAYYLDIPINDLGEVEITNFHLYFRLSPPKSIKLKWYRLLIVGLSLIIRNLTVPLSMKLLKSYITPQLFKTIYFW